MQCIYMKQKRTRKQRKAGDIYCLHFSEDKNIHVDCKTCKRRVDPLRLKN